MVVPPLPRSFKSSHSFSTWSENSTGMLQHSCWVALSLAGFGCNLQHHASYIEEIQEAVVEACEVPKEWKCTGLMPFGEIKGEPKEKTFRPVEERVKVLDK